MDFHERKRLYNLCRPEEPLTDPGDTRNVDFDALPAEIRGASWAGSLAAEIELADQPVCLLVAGLPGSGKSTELHRLAHRLRGPESAGLLPVFVDAEERLDLTSSIDIPEIVAAILEQAERAVLRAEGKPESPESGYLARFWGWLKQLEVGFGAGNLTIPGVGSLGIELKTRPTLRQQVRAAVSSHLTHFLRDARDALRDLDRRAAHTGHGGLLIIFDSLEKLKGTTSSWYDVLDSAEIFFKQSVPLLDLPVHIVFTVPTALLTRLPNIRLQPMLKLRERDGTPYEPGIAAARELVDRRIPMAAQVAIFGDDAAARIRQLILWSGGYPRELVRLLQSAIRDCAGGPLEAAAFDRLFAQLVETYRVLIPTEVIPWLVSVAQRRFMTVDNEEHRLAADRMLQNNVILYYRNGDGWHDLHPAVYANPDVRAALPEAVLQGSAGR